RGAAQAGAQGDRLLRRARAPRGQGRGVLAVPLRARSGRVQLRLVVRLLPAGVPAAGPGDDDLPPAGRRLRGRKLERPCFASTPTTSTSRGRSTWPPTASAGCTPTRSSAR